MNESDRVAFNEIIDNLYIINLTDYGKKNVTNGVKDLITYKLYLQTLCNIRDKNEVAGDRQVLEILEKEIPKVLVKKNGK